VAHFLAGRINSAATSTKISRRKLHQRSSEDPFSAYESLPTREKRKGRGEFSLEKEWRGDGVGKERRCIPETQGGGSYPSLNLLVKHPKKGGHQG